MMEYTRQDIDWFSEKQNSLEFDRFKRRPVVYFCAEYALSPLIPSYSGGLGILAGDFVREAHDRKLPFMAIGLYYYEGYICDEQGNHRECRTTDPQTVGFSPALNEQGERIIVTVPIGERIVKAQAWLYEKGSIKVYFLDTNLEENHAEDRIITNRLYVGDKTIRIKQEIVLGIGGMRLLKALGVHPLVYHLNEGRSAFLAFELIKHEMIARDLSFDEAGQFARRRMVVTNHTLVPAANEVYEAEMFISFFMRYAEEVGINVRDLFKLGLIEESNSFSMSIFSLRMAGIINGVSRLHSDKAREIWPQYPMTSITNGIHIETWDCVGKRLNQPGDFWEIHQSKKRELLALIKQNTGVVWSENDLLIGWARRFALYKRPLALLDDLRAFLELNENKDRPVRVVFSGLPHPEDKEAQAVLAKLQHMIANELAGQVVYLEHYNMTLAKKMLAGTDVWLNTPIVGFEACGTSGMKAALNGSLPCSTKDGWVAEAELYGIGWVLESGSVTQSALNTIKNEIIPMYYDKDPKLGYSTVWEEHMRNARVMVLKQFSATRMLREYVEMLYM